MSQIETIRLSPCEREVWDQIQRKMSLAFITSGKTTFNADDLKKWKMPDGITSLDKALYGVEGHKQGSYFQKLLKLKMIERVNQVLGDWNRYIWNYRVK
jgi:hypothetical protein